MQFKTLLAALLVAATAVSAAPRPVASYQDETRLVARAKKTPSGQNKFLGAPFSGSSKVNIAASRQRGGQSAAKGKAGKAGKGGNQANGAGGSSAAAAAGSSAADSSAAAATASSSAAAAASTGAAAQDSGVAGVVEGCTSADGSSGCFQILNVVGSCFSIPDPLANDVQFFLPAPTTTCTLFTDEDCQDGGVAGQGAVAQIGQNSYICNATAAATA